MGGGEVWHKQIIMIHVNSKYRNTELGRGVHMVSTRTCRSIGSVVQDRSKIEKNSLKPSQNLNLKVNSLKPLLDMYEASVNWRTQSGLWNRRGLISYI